MGDVGDDFRAWKDYKKKKKAANLEWSPDILRENDIKFTILSMEHYRVGEFDFWPTTGLFIHRKTKQRGRGVRNLIAKIRKDSV